MGAEMKTCFKCGQTKPLSEFYVHPQMADGHLNKCKECTRKERMARAIENPEREFELRMRVFNNHPTLRSLRRATEAAIACGRLTKPTACEVCGEVPSVRMEAHHLDYSDPLRVIWCCTKCHDNLDVVKRRAAGKPAYAMQKKVECVESGVVFESISEAGRNVGRSPSSVSQAIRRGGCCAGYHWRYAKEG